MAITTGIVEAISTKEVTTKFGVKPTYSIKLNGTWIKCGFKKPPANTGDQVECDIMEGSYGSETKAVTILARAVTVPTPAIPPLTTVGTTPPPSPYKSYGSAVVKPFPIPALHGDRAIIRQNALARATECFLAEMDSKKTSFEVTEGCIDDIIALARKFEAYTAGDLDLAEVMEEMEMSKKAAELTTKPDGAI